MPFAKAAQTKLMNSREIVIGLNIRAGVCHRHLSVGNRPAKMAKRKSTRMFRAVDNFMVVAAMCLPNNSRLGKLAPALNFSCSPHHHGWISQYCGLSFIGPHTHSFFDYSRLWLEDNTALILARIIC